MSALRAIRFAGRGERRSLDTLQRRSSLVWAEDRIMLERYPDALGVSPDAIAEKRVRVAVGEDGRLLGFATAVTSGESCELEDLFVDPDVMRTGVGTALVEDAASRAAACGLASIDVIAHERNFAFYESVRFTPAEPALTRFGPAFHMHRVL